jgi:hypothetical protein
MLRKQFNAGDYACATMRYSVLLLLIFLFPLILTGPFVFVRDAHLPACLLKLWLRDLSEALIPDYY